MWKKLKYPVFLPENVKTVDRLAPKLCRNALWKLNVAHAEICSFLVDSITPNVSG